MRVTRKEFLRGRFGDREYPFRPPWAQAESSFTNVCNRCDECIEACPEHILKRGGGGFPEIRFALGACTFCGECVSACETDALTRAAEATIPWALKARITDTCISQQGTACRVCGDACEEQAIRFQLETGGIARPLIDKAMCTGCGTCYFVCPVDAVSIEEPTDQPMVIGQ